MRFGSGSALVCAFCACSGKVDTNSLMVGSTGGIGDDAGEWSKDHTTTAASGGCTSATVTFQIVPAANSAISWCLGSPGSSDKCHATAIRSESGALELAQRASGCEVEVCGQAVPPPGILGGNSQLTTEGLTLTWTGAYYAYATCGASSAYECAYAQCTALGRYTIDVCGFRNPNPDWSDGCLEAGDQTPVTSVSTTFDYPASAPVLVTMPN